EAERRPGPLLHRQFPRHRGVDLWRHARSRPRTLAPNRGRPPKRDPHRATSTARVPPRRSCLRPRYRRRAGLLQPNSLRRPPRAHDSDPARHRPGTETVTFAHENFPHTRGCRCLSDRGWFEVSSGTLVLDWKPDWIKAGNRLAAPNKRNDYLVIHRTGSMSVGSAINTFTNSNNTTCIHYLLDVDGHVVKLAHENDQVNHTGPAFWQGVTQINARSIGIEVVHGGNGDFPDAQYTTLLRLVREIRAAHPNITRQNVVGHSDIATESTTNRTLSNRCIDDPGDTFDWARLENAGQVRRRTAGPPPPTAYGLRPGEYVTQSQPNR